MSNEENKQDKELEKKSDEQVKKTAKNKEIAENQNIEQSEIKSKQDCNKNEMVPKQDYDELDDRYKRILAEFENFKKRSSKEREMLYNSILSDVVEIMLPVVDNLENAAKAETEDEGYKKGVELVLKQFKDVLASKGVEEIKTEGETFDPELHEAVGSIQDENLGEKEIAQEYRKGYKIGSRVIRHSMVVVAN